MTGSQDSPTFRLAYVPGVTPDKWVRIWNDRLPEVPLTLLSVPPHEAPGVLRADGADAALLRLPVDGTDLSAIPLYTETTVVIVPKDHLLTAVDEATVADLADEIVLHPLDDSLTWERLPGRPALERPATTADAVELVAAGIGVLVVPQSLARLHHRKDLTYRPLTDAPQSRVALSWPEERTTDLVEHFIGVVRGRTPNSTRGPKPPAAQERRSAGAGAGGRQGGGAPRKGAAKSAGKSTGKGAAKSGGKGGTAARKSGGTPRGAGARRRRTR
ncbi:LysR family substrate-binding domain-containing protein [Streptomyces huiliensis]|uniref:LysR family substrate-binding domain-containing protein n=1 Tax=Streptomyces huiliensis TaxID=2876027 RepID=UPI001CC189C2|nr:LysR family substrate-binding domain-containing protein [Streptomyces huiliensis]MBZ4323924.1 LysR family substrate-binding domain-containing protein [Streptomyces huiliensis]